MLDIIESCLGDVIIITTIAGYAYIGMLVWQLLVRKTLRTKP